MADRTHRTNYDITATDRASQAFQSVRRSMGEVESAAGKLRNVLGGLGIGLSVGTFATALIKETLEAEQASARLNAVLRATGSTASFSKGELDDLAQSMQDLFGFSDESVSKAQAALLKFGNIQGNVFREGLKLSADLAAFMGSDIPEAAQMIGKSLQSPTEGLGLLERQFGKLEPEQEKFIETLVRQGRAIEAQNAVLDIWRSKIGGTAELMNQGLTKATRDVANAWSDMLEAIGKTETVGGTAVTILTDLRDLLRDIEKVSKPQAPLEGFRQQLKLIEGEIDRVEKSRPKTKRSPLVDERLAELRAERETLDQIIAAAESKAVDPFAFDPKSIDVKLGGSTKKDEAAEQEAARKRRLIEEDIRNLARGAEEMQDAGDKLIYTWDKAGNRIQVTREEFKKMQEEEQRVTESWVKTAEIATDIAEDLVYTWDRAGNRIAITRDQFDELISQQKKSEELAHDLGFTFASAFEDAIVSGGKLSDVLKGLEQDIARILIRKTVTEPAANALAGAITSYFGGQTAASAPRAAGGPVSAGMPYMVGERGPELFVPSRSGSIVPNDELGSSGPTYYIDARGADSAAIARLEGMLAALNGSIERRAVAAAVRSARSGGSLARATNQA